MTKSIQFAVFTALAITLTSISVFGIVSAQTPTMSEEHISRIRSSCLSAKNTLYQLHASDALLRVNRGQMYQSMSTKLMNRFNDRVESNNLDANNLISIAQTYMAALTAFQLDYKAYEEQLSTALKIDCSKEPVSFYDAVALARTKRTQVHTDVIKLHQYIDEYQSTFDIFEDDVLHNGDSN